MTGATPAQGPSPPERPGRGRNPYREEEVAFDNAAGHAHLTGALTCRPGAGRTPPWGRSPAWGPRRDATITETVSPAALKLVGDWIVAHARPTA